MPPAAFPGGVSANAFRQLFRQLAELSSIVAVVFQPRRAQRIKSSCGVPHSLDVLAE